MFRARAEHFEALLLRTPLQNVDIDVAHTPAFHFQLRRLVKVDCAGADQCRSVIVDNKFLCGIDDSKPGPEREARPIRSGAHEVVTREIGADGISESALFDARVGSCADIFNATKVRIRCLDSN